MRLGIVVARPLTEGKRYDLIFDIGGDLLRVQCKWARVVDGAVEMRGGTCRHSPVHGYIRGTYGIDEIDLLVAYCDELKRVYALPARLIAGRSLIRLRVSPARNNQKRLVHLAAQYELGAVAQLGERRHGMAEAAGSSPASSITPKAA